MFTKAFWRAAGERAVKTFIQAFLASPIGLTLVAVAANPRSLDWMLVQQLPWLLLLGVIAGLIAAVVSVLWSMFNARNDGNPSATNAERVSPTPV